MRRRAPPKFINFEKFIANPVGAAKLDRSQDKSKCNNSGSKFVKLLIMKKTILLKSVLVAVGLPLLAGCVVYREGPPPDETAVAEAPAPPPPQAEIIPAPPGSLTIWFWVPGEWEWRDGHWFWAGGRWALRPHPGAVWIPGGWEKRGHRHVWMRGHWD